MWRTRRKGAPKGTLRTTRTDTGQSIGIVSGDLSSRFVCRGHPENLCLKVLLWYISYALYCLALSVCSPPAPARRGRRAPAARVYSLSRIQIQPTGNSNR